MTATEIGPLPAACDAFMNWQWQEAITATAGHVYAIVSACPECGEGHGRVASWAGRHEHRMYHALVRHVAEAGPPSHPIALVSDDGWLH